MTGQRVFRVPLVLITEIPAVPAGAAAVKNEHVQVMHPRFIRPGDVRLRADLHVDRLLGAESDGQRHGRPLRHAELRREILLDARHGKQEKQKGTYAKTFDHGLIKADGFGY